MMQVKNDAGYWDALWQNAETKWDLQQPSPPLMAYADQIPAERRHLAVLIPGCGNGYEALYLLENGFSNLTTLDIAPLRWPLYANAWMWCGPTGPVSCK